MISKYAAISSIDMPDNIVMEVCPIEGSLRSREKISMPVDIKDALRIIIYKLNNKLILYIYK